MLTQEQLKEIKQHLEKAQNPLFFFDNDVDGLCSFLILQRAIGRGKGVAIRSFPELDENYARKARELNADYIFILDKPKVSKGFIEKINEMNLPIVWIDHHEVPIDKEIIEKTNYFNSAPTAEPVTYLCYKISGKKEDMWLAIIGCIGDVFKPDFAEEFSNQHPELFNSSLSAFDSLYLTEIGKIVAMLNFGLKDTTTNVVNLMRYLIKASSAQDILEENRYTKQLHKRYAQLNKIHETLVAKAEEKIDKKSDNSNLIFFTYSGQISMSSEISNRLYFNHKDKTIVVAYIKPDKINVSIRGKNAKKTCLKSIENIKGATGGGHEEACGAMIPPDKLGEFEQKIRKITQGKINNQNP